MASIIPFEEARLMQVNRKQAQETEQRKAATFDATSQYYHGPSVAGSGGLLNMPGADPRVISTIQAPLGIADLIPVYPDQNALPVFEMLTAQGDDSGSEATDLATRSKVVGKTKVVRLTAPFGRIIRSTDALSPDKMGRYVNRGEPLDLELLNGVGGSSPWIPEAARDLSLTDEIRTDWWKIGLSMRRMVEKLTFQGDGTNAGTNQGFIQFYGLQNLVNSGKTDMFTQSVSPAADPKVVAWNTAFDGTATVEGKAMDIVELFARIQYFIQARADATDMTPNVTVLAMRRDLFIKLVLFWPYSYLTAGPTATTSKIVNLDAGDMTAMRDDMRQRQYLTVNGLNIPVVFSDGIPETATGSGVKSDIYWLTIAAGGMRTLYYQFFDWSNQQVALMLSRFPQGELTATDGGKYLWAFDRTNYVAYFQALVEPRVILRTAFLCARITGVQYDSALHSLDGIPGSIYDQLVIADGGVQVGSYGTGIYTSSV